MTGADGRFAARGVGPGAYEIAADHEAAGRSPAAAVPPGAGDAELALTLPPGVVQGFVRMNGRPAKAAVILFNPSAANARLTVRTGLDGSYRIDRVAPGRYLHGVIQIRPTGAPASSDRSQELDIPAGAVVTRDVDLAPAGISVVLHPASPNNAVRFGYGLLLIANEVKLAALPLPKTSNPRSRSGVIS